MDGRPFTWVCLLATSTDWVRASAPKHCFICDFVCILVILRIWTWPRFFDTSTYPVIFGECVFWTIFARIFVIVIVLLLSNLWSWISIVECPISYKQEQIYFWEVWWLVRGGRLYSILKNVFGSCLLYLCICICALAPYIPGRKSSYRCRFAGGGRFGD